jgi:hypothetical protein
MIAIVILCVAALVCAAGVVVCAYFAYRLRDDLNVSAFIVGAIACGFGAGYTTQEAIKRADLMDKPKMERGYDKLP